VDCLLLVFAGILGGMLNAVAGGGSFITLPALMMSGLSPVMANATGTMALLPGYIASAWRLRHAMRDFHSNLWPYALVAAAGGVTGAMILYFSNDQSFRLLIPWLMLLATLAFIFAPRLALSKTTDKPGKTPLTYGLLFILCAYGGYFNGGVGIMLLAGLSMVSIAGLHSLNGIKSLMSAILTLIASIIYLSAGLIELKWLLVMSLSAIVGGHFGASLSYHLSQQTLRISISIIAMLMTLGFFYQSLMSL
jgi:hypothetical protein